MENANEIEVEKTSKQSLWELVRFAIIAIAIVIPIRIFIAQPFIVSGSSMIPTFLDGEYLIVDEISYILSNPKRDDVVVFKYPNDTKKFFIKRIIGLPNEIVDVDGNEITITNKEHPNGFKLDQSYIKNASEDAKHFELNSNEYFVMGDNRPSSSDSRYWGAVPKNLLVGRAFLRLLPISRIDLMPGDFNQAE